MMNDTCKTWSNSKINSKLEKKLKTIEMRSQEGQIMKQILWKHERRKKNSKKLKKRVKRVKVGKRMMIIQRICISEKNWTRGKVRRKKEKEMQTSRKIRTNHQKLMNRCEQLINSKCSCKWCKIKLQCSKSKRKEKPVQKSGNQDLPQQNTDGKSH